MSTQLPTFARQRPGGPAERGFTLVEVLVAMMLTLIMTGAALTALLQTSRSAAGAAALTDVNQNLRIAMNIVIRDLIQAGQDVPIGGIPMPHGAGSQPVVRPGPIGAEIEWEPGWVTVPAITPGPSIGVMINGVQTDIVSILRKDPTIDFKKLPMTVANDGSSVTVPAQIDISGAYGVTPGDLILFHHPSGNAMQEVTSVNGQTIYFGSEAESLLNQRGAAAGSIMALQDGDGTFSEITIVRVQLITYYLKQESSNALPQLIRKVNFGDERVLALGIENLQLTWDLVDGVTNPSNVEQPEAPNTANQIRKANLHMAARSLDRAATGAYLRASLSTQVSLRSLAFVDRYDDVE